MTGPHKHETHSAIVKRLKRANGHLNSVIGMIEQERSCLDIAQQLQAVEKAIAQAKKTLIQDHLDHCLDLMVNQAGKASATQLEEFKLIARFL
jgi:uncharacterized protein